MARPSTILVVFVVTMNVMAGAMLAMGVPAAMGLDNQIHDSDDVPTETEDNLPTGSGVGGTLFGMYNVLTQQAQGLFSAIFPALEMIRRAGVPAPLTAAGGSLMSFIIIFDVLSYIRGWGL